ncbi:unnamed protein product [Orchesella dallaii]|uniref:Peptidase metallopeptidase domain-containing protein n=1 Tax=Orchesella dallaii TaxID=48710 RepID=A0ABP1PV20_9HEXA
MLNMDSDMIFTKFIISFLFCLISLDFVSTYDVKSPDDVMLYLQKYGYLSPTESRLANKVTEGIKMFQLFNGMELTGKLNSKTVEQMNKPRCGMAERMDMIENEHMNSSTVSHKIPGWSRRWRSSRIFYKINNFPNSGIHPEVVRKEIRRAFRLWEGATNLKCEELAQDDNRKVEIEISFELGLHGDGYPFVNSAGTPVAHAFFPDADNFKGDIHFDNNRLWTAYNVTEINLYQVAAHEIGHALGLEHSRFPASVMHMIVHSKLEDDFQLHLDDIKGIQNLYGRRRRESKGRYFSERLNPTHPPNSKASKPLWPPNSGIINDLLLSTDQMSVSTMDLPALDSTVTNFWNCFKLSYNKDTSNEATKCYTQNVLSLLYSIKV